MTLVDFLTQKVVTLGGVEKELWPLLLGTAVVTFCSIITTFFVFARTKDPNEHSNEFKELLAKNEGRAVGVTELSQEISKILLTHDILEWRIDKKTGETMMHVSRPRDYFQLTKVLRCIWRLVRDNVDDVADEPWPNVPGKDVGGDGRWFSPHQASSVGQLRSSSAPPEAVQTGKPCTAKTFGECFEDWKKEEFLKQKID